MRNIIINFKIILIFFIFSSLIANICFADGKDSKAAGTINKINSGHHTHSKSGETITQIESNQKRSSGGKPTPTLIINATVNPTKIDRGEHFKIEYILYSQNSDLSLEDITINIPEEFENINCSNLTYINENKFNNKLHIIQLKNKLHQGHPLKITLIAKIPLNASLKIYNISELIIYDKVVCASNATLEVQNNLPNILKLYLESDPDAISEERDKITCFADSNIAFNYIVADKENNGINFNISINDSHLWNQSINDYASRIEYGKIIPGNYSIDICVRDRDGGEYHLHKFIIVMNKTYDQDFADRFLPKIILTFFSLIICLLVFKSKEMLCLNIIEPYWHMIQKIIVGLLVVWLVIAYMMRINFLMFILIIYFLITILAIGLVEINFSSMPLKIKCHLPKISLIKKILYVISKSTLTLAVIICMTISVLIVGFSLPLNFSAKGIETHYSYIFYYYSAVVQLFGTILSIVAMFTIWFMQDNKQKSRFPNYKSRTFEMLKDFMFLYISVILLSLCGLALERLPDLDVVGKIDSLVSSSAVFIFETTMLLATPAMVALYNMVKRFMEITLGEQSLTTHEGKEKS